MLFVDLLIASGIISLVAIPLLVIIRDEYKNPKKWFVQNER